jgi:PhzF family phenazine biosynthesis protein
MLRTTPSAAVTRWAAFTDSPAGGNPAGVVLDAGGLDDAAMQALAADVGASETAFLLPPRADGAVPVRYFSPEAEVPFCGHATVAAGAAWAAAHGSGHLAFATAAGRVEVEVEAGSAGAPSRASLVTVAPRCAVPAAHDVAEALAALGWCERELDPAIPPGLAYAGAWHLVLAAATSSRLAHLDYDFDRLRRLMVARGWTTLQLVHRTGPRSFRARDPFPVGGVVEDPATGAAAAALGAYLRALGAIEPPVRLEVLQGAELGRPGRIEVGVPAGEESGIRITGAAVPMGDGAPL